MVYFVGQAIFMAMIAGLLAFLFALISGFSGGGTWSSYPRTGGWGAQVVSAVAVASREVADSAGAGVVSTAAAPPAVGSLTT